MRRRRMISVQYFLVLTHVVAVVWIMLQASDLLTTLIYLTRPIWDRSTEQFTILAHYYSENMTDSELCKANDLYLAVDSAVPRVIDAMIFSNEIDMLEIRIHELWDYVDIFVVLEANATFTGIAKPYNFMIASSSGRFLFARSKLIYVMTSLSRPAPSETPWDNELRMRQRMGQFLTAELQTHEKLRRPLTSQDIILASDADEIPSAHTVRLLKRCSGWPDGLQLQLRNYRYSFEFFLDLDNWKPHANRYSGPGFEYHHSRASDWLLADAGVALDPPAPDVGTPAPVRVSHVQRREQGKRRRETRGKAHARCRAHCPHKALCVCSRAQGGTAPSASGTSTRWPPR